MGELRGRGAAWNEGGREGEDSRRKEEGKEAKKRRHRVRRQSEDKKM